MSAALQGVQGPLVRQPLPAARLAGACVSAAEALWDAATYDDPAQMWEEARAAASWVLAACDRAEPTFRKQVTAAAQPASGGALFDTAPLTGTSDPG